MDLNPVARNHDSLDQQPENRLARLKVSGVECRAQALYDFLRALRSMTGNFTIKSDCS